MGFAIEWTAEDYRIAQEELGSGRHRTVDEALVAIGARIGRRVGNSTIQDRFKAAGLRSPGFYLRKPDPAAVEPRRLSPIVEEMRREAAAPVAHELPAGDITIKPLDALTERYGSAAETRYVRGLERKVGQFGYITQRLEASLISAFSRSPIQLSQSKLQPRSVAGSRMITVMVSDIHFGLNVDPREVPGGGYSWQIAARRMARLATEVAAWKEHHREVTDLQIVFNGDIIAGRIHLDDAGVRAHTEQIHGATWILVAFVDYLSQHFARIGVSCLPGNHDRTREQRQFAQRWDSHAHAIYLALAYAFREKKQVRFDVPLTGDSVIELPGAESYAFYTHGDVKPSVANVGRALHITPMVAQLNRINASGEYDKPVRVLGVGHWHTGFCMPTGVGTIVTNGSVIGPDSYARNACGVRGKEGAPMQVMFESVIGYEFGDCRFVHLRPADNDATYDKIITTPSLDVWAA